MSDEPDLTQAITDTASEPLIYEAEGVKTQNRTLDELVKADKYLKSSVSAQSGFLGIGRFKINPPGAV